MQSHCNLAVGGYLFVRVKMFCRLLAAHSFFNNMNFCNWFVNRFGELSFSLLLLSAASSSYLCIGCKSYLISCIEYILIKSIEGLQFYPKSFNWGFFFLFLFFSWCVGVVANFTDRKEKMRSTMKDSLKTRVSDILCLKRLPGLHA